MFKCCSQGCVEPVKYCQEYCRTHSVDPVNCQQTCIDQKNICLDTCKLSSPQVGPRNDYVQCCFDQGCRGLGDIPDPECVKKNKQTIFDCCRQSCIPTKDLDCQKHCEFMQNITIDPNAIGIPLVTQQVLNSVHKKGNRNLRILFFVTILLVIATAIIVIIHARI